MSIPSTLLILFGVGILIWEYARYRRSTENRFDALFFTTMWFIMIYVVVPLCVEYDPSIVDDLLTRFYIGASEPVISLRLIGAIFLGWSSILAGYMVIGDRAMVRLRRNLFNKESFRHVSIIFPVSIAFLILFIMCYGFSAIYTNVRFGELDKSQVGTFFLEMSSRLSLISFLILISPLLSQSYKEKKHTLAVIITGIVAFYTSIQGAGRGGMIMPFLMSYLLYCQYKKRIIVNHYMILVGVIIIFFALFGRFIFAYYLFSDNPMEMVNKFQEVIPHMSISVVLKGVLGEFCYPYISLNEAFNAIQNGLVEYRYFRDIPLGVLFYSRLLGFDTDLTITYYNNYVLTGALVSSTPPGIIGLGLYNLGWLGIIFTGILNGVVVRLARSIFLNLSENSAPAVYKLILGMLVGNFVANGDPRVFVLKLLPIMLGISILAMQRKKRRYGMNAFKFKVAQPQFIE